MALDLGALDSVKAFATEFRVTYDRLDLLINNAGIMMPPYGKTVQGFETQLPTNSQTSFLAVRMEHFTCRANTALTRMLKHIGAETGVDGGCKIAFGFSHFLISEVLRLFDAVKTQKLLWTKPVLCINYLCRDSVFRTSSINRFARWPTRNGGR